MISKSIRSENTRNFLIDFTKINRKFGVFELPLISKSINHPFEVTQEITMRTPYRQFAISGERLRWTSIACMARRRWTETLPQDDA